MQTTLCFYDVKDALTLDPDHAEARIIMTGLEQRAAETKLQAIRLNINGKHREALQKISLAIETNPSVADYHVLRWVSGISVTDYNMLSARDFYSHQDKPFCCKLQYAWASVIYLLSHQEKSFYNALPHTNVSVRYFHCHCKKKPVYSRSFHAKVWSMSIAFVTLLLNGTYYNCIQDGQTLLQQIIMW